MIQYVPGLYKIFGKHYSANSLFIFEFTDEILVNAADNFQRDKTMNMIKVKIDPK